MATLIYRRFALKQLNYKFLFTSIDGGGRINPVSSRSTLHLSLLAWINVNFFLAHKKSDFVFDNSCNFFCLGVSNTIEELTKVTFTYYGTSVYNLHEIMKTDGVDEVTCDEIMQQNSAAQNCEEFWNCLPTLFYLCINSERKFFKSIEMAPIEKTRTFSTDCVDLSGRKKSVLKR